MRKFTLLAVSVLMAAPFTSALHQSKQSLGKPEISSVAASAIRQRRSNGNLSTVEFMLKRKAPVMYATGEALWRAEHDTDYYYDSMASEWIFDNECYYTYYPDGRLKTELEKDENGWTLVEYEYNADGCVSLVNESESNDGTSFTKSFKMEIAYDDVVVTQPIESKAYDWNETTGEWELSDESFRRIIKRNAAGSLESSTLETCVNGVYQPTFQAVYTYNGEERPVACEFKRGIGNGNGGYELVTQNMMENVVWDCFDGNPPEDAFDLYYGGCRIASADTNQEGGQVGTIKVTYDGENFQTEETFPDQFVCIKVNYSILDANGSNRTEEFNYIDMNMDGEYTEDENLFQSKYDVLYDDRKNETHEGYYEYIPESGYMLCDGSKAEYTYDSATGCVAEKIYYFFNAIYDPDGFVESGEFVYESKTVTSMFVDASGQSGIDAVAGAREVEFVRNADSIYVACADMTGYTLHNVQGLLINRENTGSSACISLDGLASGIYMLTVQTQSGSRTFKVAK